MQDTEKQARQEILDKVASYCAEFHNRPRARGAKLPYSGRVYDSAEMTALVDSALDFWLTAGHFTDMFEKELSEFLGVKYCLAVNSGSSANLLAFMALTSPLIEEKRRVKRGDEVITVAAGFPTTVAPIIQFGAVPVFADITVPQYNIDISRLEASLSSKTKAVFLAHTLGNPFDIKAVKDFCEARGLWLIEDNCDALGSLYVLDGEKRFTGTIGHIGTSSFYPPHHITMGEGGAVYTNDPLLNRILRSMRDWGRDCVCPPGTDNMCGERFERRFGGLPQGYDHKYVYSHFGYNLKATDMQAAVGAAQIKKLQGFTDKRRHNFSLLRDMLKPAEDILILPEACRCSEPSWFGFAMTCRGGLDRNKAVARIEESGVQTRMLFAGNLTKHPCFAGLRKDRDYRIAGTLRETDRAMERTFWVGVYPGLDDNDIKTMAEIILEACRG